MMGEQPLGGICKRRRQAHTRSSSSPASSSIVGRKMRHRACAWRLRAAFCAVVVACLTSASAANLATTNAKESNEGEHEISALQRIGLFDEETAVAPAFPTSSPSSSSSLSSSSSASPFSTHNATIDAGIVVRMPIDVQELMHDDRSFSSSSSSGIYFDSSSSSSSQDADIAVGDVTRIPIDAQVLQNGESSSRSGSSDQDGSDSGSEGGSDTISSLSRSSSSTHGSGNGSGSSSDQNGDDAGFSGNNGTTVHVSSDSSGSSADRSNATIADPIPATKPGSEEQEDVQVNPLQSDTSPETVNQSDDAAVLEVTPSSAPEMRGVPSNPTLVSAVAYDGRAEVSWKTPDDDGSDPITEYEVGWFDEEDNVLAGTQVVTQVAASFNVAQNGSSTTPSDAETVPTSAVVTHLLNGRSYTFKVRAKNVNGYSVWSAKSLAVSPLHPPDLCGRLSCSGRGMCFPNYHPERSSRHRNKRSLGSANALESTAAVDDTSSLDAQCICRPGFNPPDCSVKDEVTQYVWKVSEWSECSSGCGGGRRTRDAACVDIASEKQAPSDDFCTDIKKPSLTEICNGMECGSKLVSVKYEVEMSYDEVLFSSESVNAFELAFTTEVAAALHIPRTRLEVTGLKRGSIAVFFQILPASRVGEKSLNDIVEKLQDELNNATSTLRSKGTFARRVEPNGVKLSFSLADQTVAGGAEDISILGLIGTVLVLCFFVFLFGWFLRKRHQRILKHQQERGRPERVLEAAQSDMKRMGIRTMT